MAAVLLLLLDVPVATASARSTVALSSARSATFFCFSHKSRRASRSRMFPESLVIRSFSTKISACRPGG